MVKILLVIYSILCETIFVKNKNQCNIFNILQSRMAVQYGTFRICVRRTSHLEPYRTSVPYFSSLFETYRTNVPYPYHYKKGVPYFSAKIEAYPTVLTYRTVLPSLTAMLLADFFSLLTFFDILFFFYAFSFFLQLSFRLAFLIIRQHKKAS